MRKALISMIVTLAFVFPLSAQNTDIESLSGIQFNFGNPGARSLGMGGAFLGLADDASAVEANPAGLTILRKPEFTIEGRHSLSTTSYNERGTFPDLTAADFDSYSRNVELSFASVVLPIGNFALAAYYHQALNFFSEGAVLPQRDAFGNITGDVPHFYLPVGDPVGSAEPVSRVQCLAIQQQTGNPNACLRIPILPFITETTVDMKTTGLAGAWRMGTLSIGAAAKYQRFREGAFTYRVTDTGIPSSTALQGTLDDNFLVQYVDDITFSGGFKWAPSPAFSVGGVYKQGAKFDSPLYLADYSQSFEFELIEDTVFHVPDIIGVGVSFRPLPALTLNVDGVQVSYSNLVDDFRSTNFGTVTLDQPFEAEDVIEIHAGGEYFFHTRIPFAIRAGWWRDPAHAVEYVGPLTCNDASYAEDERYECAANRVAAAILFPKSQDQDHFSVGVGLAWPRFQIDAAYDTSDNYKVGSISMVSRF